MKKHRNTRGKNFISRMAGKARALHEKVAGIFAPREIGEFALAIA